MTKLFLSVTALCHRAWHAKSKWHFHSDKLPLIQSLPTFTTELPVFLSSVLLLLCLCNGFLSPGNLCRARPTTKSDKSLANNNQFPCFLHSYSPFFSLTITLIYQLTFFFLNRPAWNAQPLSSSLSNENNPFSQVIVTVFYNEWETVTLCGSLCRCEKRRI